LDGQRQLLRRRFGSTIDTTRQALLDRTRHWDAAYHTAYFTHSPPPSSCHTSWTQAATIRFQSALTWLFGCLVVSLQGSIFGAVLLLDGNLIDFV